MMLKKQTLRGPFEQLHKKISLKKKKKNTTQNNQTEEQFILFEDTDSLLGSYLSETLYRVCVIDTFSDRL